MKAKLYCVGVGPGDPELITLKAQRIIKECGIIAVPVRTPAQNPKDVVSFRIAEGSVPEINGKNIIPILIPMSKDRAELAKAHENAAKELEALLDKGGDVAFLCLGDPAFYSSISYLRTLVGKAGYYTESIAAVTSFSAAAARLGIPIAEWDERVHVIPTVHKLDDLNSVFAEEGCYILMKSGRGLGGVKAALKARGLSARAVENCGLKDEKVYESIDEIPDESGYFMLIIARKEK